jgi:hypothetical protein
MSSGTVLEDEIFRTQAVRYQRYRFVGRPFPFDRPGIVSIFVFAICLCACWVLLYAANVESSADGEVVARQGSVIHVVVRRRPCFAKVGDASSLRFDVTRLAATVTRVATWHAADDKRVGCAIEFRMRNSIDDEILPATVRVSLPPRRIAHDW